MSIAKQLIREFWFPLLVAVGWSSYNIYSDATGDWAITKYINIFGPSFFFVSWLTAQYFRVRKQAKVESNLLDIQARTSDLLEQLENKTADLVAHVTGGDSFCYLTVFNLELKSNSGYALVIHQGKHALYDVTARICDLQAFEALGDNLTLESIQKAEIYRAFGNITPGYTKGQEVWNLGSVKRRDFNIFWTARNGGFIQLLRFRAVGDHWTYATKVERDGVIIFEKVLDDFPRNSVGNVDW